MLIHYLSIELRNIRLLTLIFNVHAFQVQKPHNVFKTSHVHRWQILEHQNALLDVFYEFLLEQYVTRNVADVFRQYLDLIFIKGKGWQLQFRQLILFNLVLKVQFVNFLLTLFNFRFFLLEDFQNQQALEIFIFFVNIARIRLNRNESFALLTFR